MDTYIQEPKPKSSKKTLIIVLVIVLSFIIAIVAGIGGYYYFSQKQAQETIASICSNNYDVLMLENVGDTTQTGSYTAYFFVFKSEDEITGQQYSICYNNNEADYKNFWTDDIKYTYSFVISPFGKIMLTSEDGGFTDLTVETDENYKINAIYGDYGIYFSIADETYNKDIANYLKYKDMYEYAEQFKTEFLSRGYYGYSTTWNEVLENTFVYCQIDVEPSTEKANTYVVTISGEYSINPVQLPDVTREGTMVLELAKDYSSGSLVSGSDVKDACDIYIATGTTWYLDRFGNY